MIMVLMGEGGHGPQAVQSTYYSRVRGVMVQVRSTIWVDFQGNTQQTIMSTNSGGAGIEADMLAASQAARLRMWEGTDGGATGTSHNAIYVSVSDYAWIQWLCADNSVVSLSIPAPRQAIFQADGESVNTSQALIVTLNAAVVGTLLGASGSPAASILGGRRRHRNRAYPG